MDIKFKLNQFVQGCKEHNPFSNLPYAPRVNPAVKVACLLPLIGNMVGVIAGIKLEEKAGIYPSGESLRARRRLVHFQVAGAVATIATVVTLVALGIITPMGLIGVGIAAISIGCCVYDYVTIHQKIQQRKIPGGRPPEVARNRPEDEIIAIAKKYRMEVTKATEDAVKRENATKEEKKAALKPLIRRLQLHLHPDKTGGLGEAERTRREEDFKVLRDAETNLS